MSDDHESKVSRERRVGQMLDRAASSSVAVATRAFREAGFEVHLGRVHARPNGTHAGIEAIASMDLDAPECRIHASWHIAHAPGHDGVLVVLNESGDSAETTVGFQPLANAAFDDLIRRTRGRYTGIGLLDAPKVRADGLLEVLGVRGVGGKDYQAMLRALDSALQALQPNPDDIPDTRTTLRFAVPTLVTEAEMYEACATGKTSRLAESCYMGLEHQHRGPRSIDVIGLDFIRTYARMAADAVRHLPRWFSEPVEAAKSSAERGSSRNAFDAWEAFRKL